MAQYRVPRQVLVYLYRHSPAGDLEYLLLKRTKGHGGFWQGVSGAPEWRESDDDAAVREVFEETGLDITGRAKRIGYRYELRRREDDPDWKRLYGPGVTAVPEEVYAAEAPSDFQPALAPTEHVEFAWCGLEDALARLKYEDNRAALRQLDERLRASRVR